MNTQTQVSNLKRLTPEQEKIQYMYLDYVNNFLTVERFAEHYQLTGPEAEKVIQEGEHAHAQDYYNRHNGLAAV